MYSNILGVVQIRKQENPFLFDVMCDVSNICDEILLLDPDAKITTEERRMLSQFDATIKQNTVDEIDFYSKCPEWVYTAYNDERPSQRFKYMKVSLCMNPFINTWSAKLRYLWNEEYQYRADRGWSQYEVPLIYRFIEEIDYKWGNGLVPINQPGPKENCMLDLYSYQLLTEEDREDVFDLYMNTGRKNKLSDVQKYYSLLDREIMVTQAVF